LPRRRRDPLARLTPREWEVLVLIAEGRSNCVIARALVVSEAAVGKHIGTILTKLTCRLRTMSTGGCSRSSPTSGTGPYSDFCSVFYSAFAKHRLDS
jgi:DNA-binding CsgD family transcriptional regulator